MEHTLSGSGGRLACSCGVKYFGSDREGRKVMTNHLERMADIERTYRGLMTGRCAKKRRSIFADLEAAQRRAIWQWFNDIEKRLMFGVVEC